MWLLKQKQTTNIVRKFTMAEAQQELKVITEGQATIKSYGKVFYNPVQEFNRDLSISVISSFAKLYHNEKLSKQGGEVCEEPRIPGVKYEDGISILEALSATGLRSIRYAKEIAGIKHILANDLSIQAVKTMTENIKDNAVEDLVGTSMSDATLLMYQRRKERFDVIDLDPYGCPSIFLDGAVQAINDGGLLLVTATDMAVLAGNSPETCYSKYGAISLRTKSCHEMAVRILLQCIDAHANRYGRYIVPLISISVDFYIRVFVRVYSGSYQCKFNLSKLSTVFYCASCDSFQLQPMGQFSKKDGDKNIKFSLPVGPYSGSHCEHCKSPIRMGGPIWSAPIHDPNFTNETLQTLSVTLKTYKRLEGVLNVILEELPEPPLYYSLDRLSYTVHGTTPPMLTFRSALLNAGYQVSGTHMSKTSFKTDAPSQVIWDIVRCWVKENPISEKRLVAGTPTMNILSVEPQKLYSFERHPLANPESRKQGLIRFQMNPLPFWGPGTRATTMTGEEKITKSRRNQGKRKRETSEEHDKDVNKCKDD